MQCKQYKNMLVCIANKQWQPLLHSCCYPELIWHFSGVLRRITISQCFQMLISGLKINKGRDLWSSFFQFLACLLAWKTNKPSVYRVCFLRVRGQPCLCSFVISSLPASFHRNWCAYVVTRTVSCVMEDGVETYIKPDYQRCTWGQCPRVAWVSVNALCVSYLCWLLVSVHELICILPYSQSILSSEGSFLLPYLSFHWNLSIFYASLPCDSSQTYTYEGDGARVSQLDIESDRNGREFTLDQ